jgi:transcriptional regulator with XRE-family HTH domain
VYEITLNQLIPNQLNHMKNDKIFTIRKALGLSQTQIAKLLQIAQSNYSTIESGTLSPSSRVQDALYERMGVNINYIKGIDTDMFIKDEPLLSSRLLKTIVGHGLNERILIERLSEADKKIYGEVMGNRFFPDREFIERVFAEHRGIDIDYIMHGRTFSNINKKQSNNYTLAVPTDNVMRDVVSTLTELSNRQMREIDELRRRLKQYEP